MKTRRVSFHVRGISLPQAVAADLLGKQSVRATFKLPEHTINIVSLVAALLGIKQKSLFDHLMDDLDVLRAIAGEIESLERPQVPKVQKTYVISRKALDCLEGISRQFNVPRDLLVELSVQRLLPIIEKERLKIRKRKKALARLQKFLLEGSTLLNDCIAGIGDDDPAVNTLYNVVLSSEHAFKEIETLVQQGEMIEELLKRVP